MSVSTELESVIEQFRTDAESVCELMNFDRFVLDFAIRVMSDLGDRLRKADITNTRLLPDIGIRQLENIRQNDSLRPKYRMIANQAVVLLVSHFAAAVEDLFKIAINYSLEAKSSRVLDHEEIKLQVGELAK